METRDALLYGGIAAVAGGALLLWSRDAGASRPLTNTPAGPPAEPSKPPPVGPVGPVDPPKSTPPASKLAPDGGVWNWTPLGQVPDFFIDVPARQRELRFNGFDPGPIDGIDGPKTKSAGIAYATANGFTYDPADHEQRELVQRRMNDSMRESFVNRGGIKNPYGTGSVSTSGVVWHASRMFGR